MGMLTQPQEDFLALASKSAVQSEMQTGFPAAITVAQAIYESGWGKAMPGNNALGIKSDSKGSGVQYVLTEEYLNGQWIKEPLAFETYASVADCFVDHARLITTGAPYAGSRCRVADAEYRADLCFGSRVCG
jgi:flagellum-specific peptidoglycan hydrolase FlgJ